MSILIVCDTFTETKAIDNSGLSLELRNLGGSSWALMAYSIVELVTHESPRGEMIYQGTKIKCQILLQAIIAAVIAGDPTIKVSDHV